MISWLLRSTLTSAVIAGWHVLSTAGHNSRRQERHKQPHLIYVLADDLGYASVGFNSPAELPPDEKPQTAEIDRLRKTGAVLNRFYTYKFCSPSRSSFISGRLPIHVNQANPPMPTPGGGVPIGMQTIAEVLKRGGYRCHVVGKWHCGASDVRHLPVNRGFKSFFGCLGGRQGHYSQEVKGYIDLWRDHKPATGETGTYSGYLYTAEAVRLITEHDTKHPFFLFMSYTLVHHPQEVPDRFLDLYPSSMNHDKRIELAMITCMDEGIRNITDALSSRGMYDDTLIIFSSDNGGVGNNYPLRGNKGNMLEGGVRVVALVSGGFLPSHMRGGTIDAYMHIVDLYATFASFAGQDPKDDAGAALGFPPVDALDMSDVITGKNSTSPREEIPLASQRSDGGVYPAAFIWCPRGGTAWKLLHGKVEHHPIFHTPRGYLQEEWSLEESGMFNKSSTTRRRKSLAKEDGLNCETGCLFNLDDDPGETRDVATDNPEVLKRMMKRSIEFDATCYQSNNAGEDKHHASELAKSFAHKQYGGHWGPWMNLEKTKVASFLQRADGVYSSQSDGAENLGDMCPHSSDGIWKA